MIHERNGFNKYKVNINYLNKLNPTKTDKSILLEKKVVGLPNLTV